MEFLRTGIKNLAATAVSVCTPPAFSISRPLLSVSCGQGVFAQWSHEQGLLGEPLTETVVR